MPFNTSCASLSTFLALILPPASTQVTHVVGGGDSDAAMVVPVGVEERDRAGEIKVGPEVEHCRGTQRAKMDSTHLLTVRASFVSHPQLHQVVVRYCGEGGKGEALRRRGGKMRHCMGEKGMAWDYSRGVDK